MADPETVCVGIDGAHFELIQPWLDSGKLPNIQTVLETGISGDLTSVLPPVTSPNWKSYATGKNPGKLGIFWWENVDTDGQRVYYPSDRKQRQPEFWELLAQERPVGVIGVPTTYPPKQLDGFYVSGAPDGEEAGFASPPGVEEVLETDLDYRIQHTHSWQLEPDAAAEEALELIESRFRAATELLQEYDVSFLQVTTFYVNSLHHFRWDDEYTLRAWQLVDEYVGEFLDMGGNVVLMSDHGSTRIDTVFQINTWLEQEGYLTLDADVTDTLHSVGITTDRLLELTNRLGIADAARRVAPQWLLDRIPNDSGELKRESKTDAIDWEGTTALASGQGPVYLTLDRSDPQYETVRDELAEKLRAVETPNGDPLASAVLPGEDVYSGEYMDDAPDLVVDQAPGIHIPGRVGRDEVFIDPETEDWRAENKRQGLFAASGPDFTTGTIESLSILDLAPTLLHLYDQPIPTAMDGSVRQSVFATETDASQRDPTFREVTLSASEEASTDETLQDRLTNLGYLE